MTYKLYIGSNNQTKKLEKTKALSITAQYFQGFTFTEATGFWQGNQEQTMILEIETNRRDILQECILKLKDQLHQQSIGVMPIGSMQFVG